MRNDRVKILPIILNVILVGVVIYLATMSYLNIDYDAGITYFTLIFGYLSKFLLIGIYVIIFILINVLRKKQSSLLNLMYFISLVVLFILAWLRLNNKEYLAFFELVIPPILFYLNIQETRSWWYASKVTSFWDKVKSFRPKLQVKKRTREALLGYSFISLWLVGLIVLMLYPIGYSFYLTFTESYYHAGTGITSTWAGFKNYVDILRSQRVLPMFSTYFIE